jgi:hypothetical protein
MPLKIVAVLTDLIFTVKISDAAKRAGVPLEFAKTAAEALQKAEGAAAIILDLNFAPPELIADLKSGARTHSIQLIGYVSHVHTDVIHLARANGCDTILARSAFVQGLQTLMQDFANTGKCGS